jgi:formylglycine-generating enzyme required for sulfatase activity
MELSLLERLQGSQIRIQQEPGGAWISPRDRAEMVRVDGGTVRLPGAPARSVRLSPFFLYAREVTQSQFAVFLSQIGTDRDERGRPMIAAPDHPDLRDFPFGLQARGALWIPEEGFEDCPMVFVTWYGAMAYARWAGGTLPSEAQWEAAAAAGATSPYPWGEDWQPGHAWSVADGGTGPRAVGTGKPNALGLYDMLGNAWEWCLDVYDPGFPASPAADRQDPVNLGEGVLRSIRGGGWNSTPEQLRLTVRTGVHPFHAGPALGFRVAFSAAE